MTTTPEEGITATNNGHKHNYQDDQAGLQIGTRSELTRVHHSPLLETGNCFSTEIDRSMADTDHNLVHQAPRLARDSSPLDQDISSRNDSMLSYDDNETDGLCPLRLSSTTMLVTGSEKKLLSKQNNQQHNLLQQAQLPATQWSELRGDFFIPDNMPLPVPHVNHMCPSGLARLHPAGDMLKSWAQFGCPTMTDKPWTPEEMAQAIARGPHTSARSPEAIEHFRQEIKDKVAAGQARTVLWDEIKHDPPPQLKISPIAAVPHSSKPFRSMILDLSFSLSLDDGQSIPLFVQISQIHLLRRTLT